jgi:hypothetical protein
VGMDREKWLAIRNTPKKTNREKMIHVSTNYGLVDEVHTPGKPRSIKVSPGKTFRRTQNKG